MNGFDYSLVAADYSAGVKRLQRRIEEAGDFWDRNHPPEPLWPIFSWPRRLNKWKEARSLFIGIAMEVDWRTTFRDQMRAARAEPYTTDNATALYGQEIEKPLPKLSRLLDSIPYQNTGMDREKAILLLLLDDDGSSWGLPVELLMQLVGIPDSDCAAAVDDLQRTAIRFDEEQAKKRSNR